MQLYAGPAGRFIADATHNAIADELKTAFQRAYRYTPPDSEVRSWRNSLRAMSQVLNTGGLRGTSVVLEYQLPLTSKRLDCMVLGTSGDGADNAVIVELKQWDDCRTSEAQDCVVTWLGGTEREVLHPSAQVMNYRTYLEDMHTSFHESPAMALHACAYLHNLNRDPASPLLDPRYGPSLKEAPLFFGNQASNLVDYLGQRVEGGDRKDLLERFQAGRARASRKLMLHVAQMIRGSPVFTLLDEQVVVLNKIRATVQGRFHAGERTVFLVQGGPGTGKSLIAARLVGELNALNYRCEHATGSKAFTGNLRKSVGSRAGAMFRFFNSYGKPESELDVLVCDEAHRLRPTSNSRFTRTDQRTDLPQVDELVRAARVSVFLIDDLQGVRPYEVGSSAVIREAAERQGAHLEEHALDVHFRCAGSEGFVNWVDNTLQAQRTANVLWNGSEGFDFQIVPTVFELERLIRAQAEAGRTARLVAGFCWPWAKQLGSDGQLVPDVVVGEWRRPWNAHHNLKKHPTGVPKAVHWATDRAGINQVGCIYTAQGFEFDYVGVIFGRDFAYDQETGQWIGYPKESHDPAVRKAKDFTTLVRQAYRVLLTRGMRGCYVTFLDPDTEAFFRSRMETDRPSEYLPSAKPARLVADAPPAVALTRPAMDLWSMLEPILARRHDMERPESADEARETVNALAHALDRPDLHGWETEPALERRMISALSRVLQIAVDDPELSRLVQNLRHRIRSA